ARRGELHLTLAVGYVKADDNRIEKDPDRRVQDGISLVFHKFAELHSIRQVLLWFGQENILVPTIVPGRGKRPIEWKAPVYHTLHHILTNPVYAGSYAYGRRGTRVTIEGGRRLDCAASHAASATSESSSVICVSAEDRGSLLQQASRSLGGRRVDGDRLADEALGDG